METNQEKIQEAKELLGKDRTIEIMSDVLEKYDSRNQVALCPNHKEKTPSLSWYEKANSFYCFGCETSFDILDYYMDFKYMTFMEAVETLYDLVGFEIKSNLTTEEKEINKVAYQKRLATIEKMTVEGIQQHEKLFNSIAYNIITKDWGLQDDTIRKYKLGFEDTGTFKDRIIIPYLDTRGNTIYRTGRTVTNNSSIKYLKETSKIEKTINDKKVTGRIFPSNPIYNAQALDSYKDDVLVVEGEKDALTLLQAGYQAVAYSGGSVKGLEILNNYEDIERIYVIPDKEITNIGNNKAIEVAELLGITKEIYIAELPLLENTEKTDVNDYFNYDRAKFKVNLDELLTKSKEYIHQEKPFSYLDDKGRPQKRWENLNHILWLNEIDVKYNKLTNKIEILGLNSEIGYDAMATDIESLCVGKGLILGKLQLGDFIHRVAMKNQYSPVQEYLLEVEKKEFDNTNAIRELYNTLEVVDDTSFKYDLFRKWLIKTVALAFNDDCKQGSDGVLILQGEQGLGKTRWIQSIVPNLDWVGEELTINPRDKDSVIIATGFWITELAELESMTTKSEQGSLKAFLTANTDRYRIPYGRNNEEFPRYTSFYGSVNQIDFLADETGNRRYWPLEVTEINYQHDVDLDKLWNQVMKSYRAGERHWLNAEELEKLNVLTSKHKLVSPVEQRLRDLYNWENLDDEVNHEYLTASQITDRLGINTSGREFSNAYSNVLIALGYTQKEIDEKYKTRRNVGNVYRVPSKFRLEEFKRSVDKV